MARDIFRVEHRRLLTYLRDSRDRSALPACAATPMPGPARVLRSCRPSGRSLSRSSIPYTHFSSGRSGSCSACLRRRKAYGKAQIKRAVILGFDGMDPELTERFIAEGRLPNLAKLREQGTFRKLRTTYPAISPVAWSTFMTGVNPGKHNIYDFLARDLTNYLPYLSSAEIKGPKRSWKIGKYTIPLGRPRIKGMRKGTPFWHWLGEAGIFCSVIRVPVTFPPEKFPACCSPACACPI